MKKNPVSRILTLIAVSIIIITTPLTHAESGPDKVPFNFLDKELTEVTGAIVRITGRKIIVDPSVRGKISIHNAEPVTPAEAWSAFQVALALNGFTTLEIGPYTRILSARNAQRSYTDVVTDLPRLDEERMITWVHTLKHIPVDEINKRLRILPSKDGEMTPFPATNSLIISDWVSNLHRIAKIIERLDVPGASGRHTRRDLRPTPTTKKSPIEE